MSAQEDNQFSNYKPIYDALFTFANDLRSGCKYLAHIHEQPPDFKNDGFQIKYNPLRNGGDIFTIKTTSDMVILNDKCKEILNIIKADMSALYYMVRSGIRNSHIQEIFAWFFPRLAIRLMNFMTSLQKLFNADFPSSDQKAIETEKKSKIKVLNSCLFHITNFILPELINIYDALFSSSGRSYDKENDEPDFNSVIDVCYKGEENPWEKMKIHENFRKSEGSTSRIILKNYSGLLENVMSFEIHT